MMHRNIFKHRTLPLAAVLSAFLTVILGLGSCNSKEGDDPYYEASSTVAVNSFSLRANEKVLSNLDSVFFSIDLNHGVIFNADSLPKGTDVTKLPVNISYPTTVKAATITMTGGEVRTGTVNYMTNSTDSIDFSGSVILTLEAENGVDKRDYILKVNVHEMEPDRMRWDEMAVTSLPARLPSPREQKSVTFKLAALALIEENDGSFTLSTNDAPDSNPWVKKEITLPFTPRVRSLAASDDALYMLSDDGSLFTSTDGLQWSATGKVWHNIIGGYGKHILGLALLPDGMHHAVYPEAAEVTEALIAPEFPIEGFSNIGVITSRWTSLPSAIIYGGRTAAGTLSDKTWGFDGREWAILSEGTMPALEGASLVPYFTYRKTTTSWIQTEYSVWLLMGGRGADGLNSKTVYLSYNNGVNWEIGGEMISLPDYVPAMSQCDNVVLSYPISGSLANWLTYPSKSLGSWYRIVYEVDGYDISWQCPVVYLIGGRDNEMRLCDTIWRGVLNRLMFTPIF